MPESLTQEQVIEWYKCSEDPQYFINTYCRLKDNESGVPVSFTLFQCQKDMMDMFHGKKYSIILKARQLGASWLSGAYCLWTAMFKPLQFCLVISAKEELAIEYLDKVKFMFSHLPDWLKPDVYKDNDTVLWFGKKDSKGNIIGLNSQIKSIPTAPDAGRSKSLSVLVMDEAAFINFADDIWASASGTVTNTGGRIILISTGNGVGGFFYDMWEKAKRGDSNFTHKFLMYSDYPGRDEAWYELTKRNSNDRKRFEQEYPRNEREAFLLSGNPYFDIDKIEHRLKYTIKPEKSCNLSLKDDKINIDEHNTGFVKIWKMPVTGMRYAIGADVSEGNAGGDYSCAYVLDDTLDICASWYGKCEPDIFGVELWKLGKLYNNAIITCEINGHGVSTLQVLAKGHPEDSRITPYRNLYYRETYESFGGMSSKYGWRTDMKTRPMIIDAVSMAINSDQMKIVDSDLLHELSTIVFSSKSKVEAQTGKNDDRMFGYGIALLCRKQLPKRKMSNIIDPIEDYGYRVNRNSDIKDYKRDVSSLIQKDGDGLLYFQLHKKRNRYGQTQNTR